MQAVFSIVKTDCFYRNILIISVRFGNPIYFRYLHISVIKVKISGIIHTVTLLNFGKFGFTDSCPHFIKVNESVFAVFGSLNQSVRSFSGLVISDFAVLLCDEKSVFRSIFDNFKVIFLLCNTRKSLVSLFIIMQNFVQFMLDFCLIFGNIIFVFIKCSNQCRNSIFLNIGNIITDIVKHSPVHQIIKFIKYSVKKSLSDFLK